MDHSTHGVVAADCRICTAFFLHSALQVFEWREWKESKRVYACALRLPPSACFVGHFRPPRSMRVPCNCYIPTSAETPRDQGGSQQDSLTYIVTPLCNCKPVFEVTGTWDRVSKSRCDTESYISLCSGVGPDSVIPASLVVLGNRQLRHKNLSFGNWRSLKYLGFGIGYRTD